MDIPDLRKFGGRPRDYGVVANWLNLSCPSLLHPPVVYLMTDSPAIKEFYSAWAAHGHRGIRSLNGTASLGSTRSWMNELPEQTEVARDLVEGGQAQVLYYSLLTSFVQPMVARSMCLKRLEIIDDPQLMLGRSLTNKSGSRVARGRKGETGSVWGMQYIRSLRRLATQPVTSRCPTWAQIFPRHMYTDSCSNPQRYSLLQKRLGVDKEGTAHPCYKVADRRCRVGFLTATA